MDELRVHVLDDRQEEVVFRREVVDDHSDVGAGVAGDLSERCAVHALRQETPARGFDDAWLNVAARSGHQTSFFRKRNDDSTTKDKRIAAIHTSSPARSENPL